MKTYRMKKWFDRSFWRIATTTAIALGTSVISIDAASVTVPPTAAAADAGNGSSLLISAIRLQQVYGAQLFPGGRLRIEEIRLRPSARFGLPFSTTISNLQIQLSTTAAHSEVLNAQFENNHGANKTVVFSGAAPVSSAFAGPTNGPKEIDVRIPLMTPFIYEPAAGNLLIDWQNFSGSTATYIDAAGSGTDFSSRAFALGGASTVATTVDNGAEVLELVFTVLPPPPGPNIAIANHSFEEPAVADGQYNVNNMPGWVGGGSWYHVANPRDDWFAGTSAGSGAPSPIDGLNIGGINTGTTIYQDLAVVVQPGASYTLTLLTGHRIGVPFGSPTVSLIAGGQVLAEDIPAAPAEGRFAPFQLTYNSPGSGSPVGQTLRIQLKSTGTDAQPWFDDLKLTVSPVTLPPPPSPTYDLSRDYSLASNPNGVWSYGSKTNIDGQFTPLSYARVGTPQSWEFQAGVWPAIYRNNSASTITTDGGQGVFAPGSIWLAAGENGTPRKFGVIRFTVPPGAGGSYLIKSRARSGLVGPVSSDADFHVARNGTELFGINQPASSTNWVGYSNTLSLAAGDTIDLLTGRGADGSQPGSVLIVEGFITALSTNEPPPGPNVAIANHSFEEPAVADGQYTVNNMPGWVGGGSWYHVANPRDDWFAGTTAGSGVPSPIDGLNIGGINTGTTIYQDLAVVVQPGVAYTLTLLTGHRMGAPFGSLTVSLIAGGQVLAEGLPVAPAEGRFTSFQLIYNSPESGSAVGQTLRIQLKSAGTDAQPWFDDLKLTVSPLTPPPPPPLAGGLVVPNELATNDAAFGSGTLANAGFRSQQVYGASEFGSVTGAVVITELRFRPDYFYGRAFSATVANLQINLSTTTRSAESLSSVFANNLGADDTVVFSGPLSVSSSFSGPANGPKTFDIRVPLATPFVYNPAAGGLLLDIRNLSGSTASLLSGQAVNDGASRVAGGINASSGAPDAGVDALQLVFTPTNTPTPASSTYNLAGNFSLASNPNGVWSYGSKTNIGGQFTPLSYARAGTAQSWEFQAGVWPAIYRNNSTNTLVTDGGQGVFPPGSIWLAAGENGTPRNFGVIRFTVPAGAGGSYLIESRARSGFVGPISSDADFHVARNGTELFGLNRPASSTNWVGYTNTLTLAAGDTIDLLTGRGSDGSQPGSLLVVEGFLTILSTNEPPPPVVPPVIVNQPQDTIVPLGQMASFSVIATGAPPLSYQWNLGGAALEGKTNSSISISNAQPADAGGYQVIVSNTGGSVTSMVANLMLILPPPACDGGIVPQVFQSVEAGSGSSVLRNAIRLQEVYGAQEFPPQPIIINEIRLRPSAAFGSSFVGVISNIQVNLSTTLKQPDSLSATFAQNTGSNDTVVFSGVLPLSSGFVGPAGGPKNFDIVIPLQTPFRHDPARGSLLVDFRNFSGGPVTFVDAGQAPADHASRAFALGGNSTTATTLDSGADVLKLCYILDVIPPPTITGQPQSRTVGEGASASFSVQAFGAPPLNFQWWHEGNPLGGQTGSSLTLSNVQLSDGGGYFAVASNMGGSATSVVATLTVIAAPPACDGGVVPQVFQAVEAGNGSSVLRNAIRLQEIYGAQNFPTQAVLISEIRLRPSAVSGAAFSGGISNLQVNLSTTPRLPDGLSAVFAENPGSNDTVVFSGTLPLSSSFSGPAAGPKDFDIIIPLQTPFRHDPTQGSLLVDFRNFSGGPPVTFVDAGAAPNDGASRAFALGASTPNATTRDTGADVLRFCYTILTNPPPPVVVPPTIVLQPRDTNVFVGRTALLRVSATGTAPLRYQWYFENLLLPGRTTPFLLLSNVQPSQAGYYHVIVTNLAGSAISSNALLTINIPSNRPPAAFTQSRSVPEDSSVQVFLAGSDPDGNPLTYSITTPPAHGTLSGTPPDVTYTPAPNFNGTDSFQFQVSDGQFSSAAATVALQIIASNDLPTLIATAGVLFPLGNGDTNWYILSTNNTDATVVFDASPSSDPDGTSLSFLWYLAGEIEPFASGTITTNTLPVGTYNVLVIVNDGVAMLDAPISFEIVTAADLLETLSSRIKESSISRKDKRPLLETLKKSGSEFDRNKLKQALEKLEHFQKKVRTHIVRDNPESAQEWLAFTDQILDAFGR